MATSAPQISSIAPPALERPEPDRTAARRTAALRSPGAGAAMESLFGPSRLKEMAVPLAVLGILLAMIAPLPPLLLDLLISANITLSVIVLMVAMHVTRPVDFNVFPTTLLLMTLFRLALNVSSARLILLNGNAGTAAAGSVIEAFGNFVVGGNYVIGVVIFLVLIAIQYVVINHGAVRISEVTARFTLDALPGKQMSVDSDLNAGLIDESEARVRRKQLAQEAEFYGAMDGASRFTQRDAVAGILITAINIIAGFLIGVLQHGMDFRRALETYTVLTIGDGLVTVIPALMISISGGMVVTRASSDAGLGADFHKQVFSHSSPLLLAGGVLLAMAAFPGLPKIPFLVLGGGVGALGWRMRGRELAARGAAPALEAAPPSPKESVESLLRVDPLAVEVGLGLVKLVEGGANSPLLRRIAAIRRQMAADLGYVLPAVRVTDNLSQRATSYTVLLKGVEAARYEMPAGCELAIQNGRGAEPPGGGLATREPAFGLAAWWIPAARADEARAAGYTVVDPVSVLGTHLAEVVRRYAHELFSRQDTKKLLDRVAEENPRLVEDLVPKLLPMASVQKVLQNLLRERVSIRDGASILEALGEAATLTRNPLLITEYVRQSIRRVVVKPYLDANGALAAYLLDPAAERPLEAAIEHGETASHLNWPPQKIRELADRVARAAGGAETASVLVCGSGVRHFLRQILEGGLPGMAVLSHNEIPPGVQVVSLGTVQ